MPSKVPEFQFALVRLAQQLERRSVALVSRISRLAQYEAMQFITDAYPELARPFITSAIQLTLQWYEEQPAPMGNTAFIPRPAEPAPDDQLAISGRWALTQANPGIALGGNATKVVFNGSRDTVLQNVEAEPGTQWARYASPNACSFCRILATREVLYRTKLSATRVVGRTPKPGKDYAGQVRGTRDLGEKFHDNCHCIAVPVRAGDIYQPPPFAKQWQQDYTDAVKAARADRKTKGKSGAVDLKDIVNAMDRAQRAKLGANRGQPVETPAAPAAGTPGRSNGPPPPPPKKPPAAFSGDDWSEDDRARRQEALGIETHGEKLTRQEIEFVERFHAAGERLDWIPKDHARRRPTNDFVWVSRQADLEVELKSTRARYQTIHGQIVKAASRAAKQNVTKDNFIIDIGDESLTADLRDDLASFNTGRRKYRLAGLWVMARGQLHKIELRE